MPLKIKDLEAWTLGDLQSKFFEENWDTDDDEANDLITEIVDARMPKTPLLVLEVSLSFPSLACLSPWLKDSNCNLTPLELIESNMSEHLRGKLLERYYRNKRD